MSGSNRVTLAQLDKMTGENVANIPFGDLKLLLEDVAECEARVAARKKIVADEISRRLNGPNSDTRTTIGKSTGTVRFDHDGFVIVADAPKNVEWDQAKLVAAIATVQQWGEPVTDYVDIKYSVPEKRYEAWPLTIKKVFEPARTVSPGKPKFKIEEPKDARKAA